MSGRFQHGEAGLFHLALVQLVDAADLGQHGAAEFQTVGDGRGLRQVDQGPA